MATRDDRLDRLVVKTPCPASWDEMEGDERRRRCSLCRRDVLDFARMTEPEIHAHLEASRGRLCGRLTRSAGRLEIQEAASGAPRSIQRNERRASSLAASFVTAFLASGLASARAEGTPVAPDAAPTNGAAEVGKRSEILPEPAASAALRGRVVDAVANALPGSTVTATSALDGSERIAVTREDGSFVLGPLPAGIYDVRADLDGFDSVVFTDFALPAGETRPLEMVLTRSSEVSEVTVGEIGVEPEPIRLQYQESDLVIAARAGATRIASRRGELVEVETELLLDATYKGRVAGRKVLYRRSDYLPEGPVFLSSLAGDLVPGARALAFLVQAPADGEAGAQVFRTVGSGGGVRVLKEAERETYLARVEALARLDRKGGEVGIDPSDLMEWMVATAEGEEARGEAAREIYEAVWVLDELAKQEGKSREGAAEDLRAILDRHRAEGRGFQAAPRPAVLAATLTARQEARLSAALRRTETFRDADIDLYQVVQRWDEGVARKWLGGRVQDLQDEAGQDEERLGAFWLLVRVASDQGDEELDAAVTEAAWRRSNLLDDSVEGTAVLTAEEKRRALAENFEELRSRLLAALAPPI